MDRLHEEIKYIPHPSVPVDPLRPLENKSGLGRPSSVTSLTPTTPTATSSSHSDIDYETCDSSNGDSALSMSSLSSKGVHSIPHVYTFHIIFNSHFCCLSSLHFITFTSHLITHSPYLFSNII